MLPLSRFLYRGCQPRCGLKGIAFSKTILWPHTTAYCMLPQTRSACRSFHTTTPAGNNPHPGRMKVFYIPNPFKWLHNRMELAALKRDWDPSFDIESFKFGVLQAVCTVTELVSRREWGELCGLLTQKAIDDLRSTKWTYDQSHNLVMSPENVQVVQINTVNLQTVVDRKYCDIDMIVIATRTPYCLEKHSVVMLEYFARFHREYTDNKLPEWTITLFKLQNFQAVLRKNST